MPTGGGGNWESRARPSLDIRLPYVIVLSAKPEAFVMIEGLDLCVGVPGSSSSCVV